MSRAYKIEVHPVDGRPHQAVEYVFVVNGSDGKPVMVSGKHYPSLLGARAAARSFQSSIGMLEGSEIIYVHKELTGR